MGELRNAVAPRLRQADQLGRFGLADELGHQGADDGVWTEGQPCGPCGRRFTTERAMSFHLGPEGECLDPVTARRPRGGFILSIVADGPGGVPVWGWPRKVLDVRDL